MATINLAVNVEIVGGPLLSIARSRTVEAYDRIEVTLDPVGAGGAEKSIDIQPGTATQVCLIVIKSNLYGAELSYKASDGVTDTASITLDEPQVWSGTGAIGALGVAPKTLKVKNAFPVGDATKKVTLEILVGRDATP